MFKKTAFLLSAFILIAACSSVKIKPISEMKEPKEIYEEGLKLVTVKDYNKAIKYFNYIVENFKSPEHEKYVSWSIYEIGFCYHKKGDDTKAIVYFDNVLASSRTKAPRILADLVKNKIKKGDGYKNASYN